jgi:hypothetical protein
MLIGTNERWAWPKGEGHEVYDKDAEVPSVSFEYNLETRKKEKFEEKTTTCSSSSGNDESNVEAIWNSFTDNMMEQDSPLTMQPIAVEELNEQTMMLGTSSSSSESFGRVNVDDELQQQKQEQQQKELHRVGSATTSSSCGGSGKRRLRVFAKLVEKEEALIKEKKNFDRSAAHRSLSLSLSLPPFY